MEVDEMWVIRTRWWYGRRQTKVYIHDHRTAIQEFFYFETKKQNKKK